MNTKLTLTIEREVIETAKSYARKQGRSLSDIVENYLKNLDDSENVNTDFSPRVKRLIGAVKLPVDFDYKESLREAIGQKHIK